MPEPERSKILVVDDEVDNRDLFVMILSETYQVTEATNGADAADIAQREPLDLIVLDYSMPNMTGLDLVRLLRGRKETKNVPILIISTHGEANTIKALLEAGANAYMVKPCSVDEIRSKVKDLLARS